MPHTAPVLNAALLDVRALVYEFTQEGFNVRISQTKAGTSGRVIVSNLTEPVQEILDDGLEGGNGVDDLIHFTRLPVCLELLDGYTVGESKCSLQQVLNVFEQLLLGVVIQRREFGRQGFSKTGRDLRKVFPANNLIRLEVRLR